MSANLEPDDPNEGSQRGGNAASGEPEVAGGESGTAKLISELDDLRQTLLRRQADFDNYRKRIEKERTEDSSARRLAYRRTDPGDRRFEHALAAHAKGNTSLPQGLRADL